MRFPNKPLNYTVCPLLFAFFVMIIYMLSTFKNANILNVYNSLIQHSRHFKIKYNTDRLFVFTYPLIIPTQHVQY